MVNPFRWVADRVVANASKSVAAYVVAMLKKYLGRARITVTPEQERRVTEILEDTLTPGEPPTPVVPPPPPPTDSDTGAQVHDIISVPKPRVALKPRPKPNPFAPDPRLPGGGRR